MRNSKFKLGDGDKKLIYFRVLIILLAVGLIFLPLLNNSEKEESLLSDGQRLVLVVYGMYCWFLFVSYFMVEKLKAIMVVFGGVIYIGFIGMLTLVRILFEREGPSEADSSLSIGFYLFLILYPLILIEYLVSRKK